MFSRRFCLCLTALFLITSAVVAGDHPVNLIKLPSGFHIEVYLPDVPGARSMAQSPKGTLFIGTRGDGKVYAIPDGAKPMDRHRVQIIASGLHMPNGVAFRDGALYVAEVNRVLRFDNIESHLENPPKPVVVASHWPDDESHGWKFIRFGPDGKLYVPVGAPCNICEPKDKRYASITRMNADGSGFEVFASGIRNTVGFDWDPLTKELWFTDNGRDNLGDEKPPDELNHAPKAGMNFGYPYLHGKDILDPQFGGKHSVSEFTIPAQELGPHVAALGMRFYTGTMFPPEYRNQIFIAEHGSWNRSHKIGYRISLVKVKDNKAISYSTFAEGFLQSERAWGRPVDLEVLSDGSMLVSDDEGGAVYRITYRKK